jgi:hypothetical protein
MSEKNRGLSFEKIDQSTNRDVQMLQHDFSTADSIPAAAIDIFAKEIAKQINSAQTLDEQKIFLIDLLQDEALERVISLKTKHSGYSQEDIEEIKAMAKYSTKQIKKAIVEKFKKYLSEELYFFIKKYVDADQPSHNAKLIVENKNGELFFKITDKYSEDLKENLHNALEQLKNALAGLSDPAQMPFLVKPLMVNRSKSNRAVLTVVSEPKDLLTIQEIFENDEHNFSLKEKLSAIIDCLRGAKFLADSGLTLTDLATREPGRNMGINKMTKKGILFDLDGLLQSDIKTKKIIVAQSGGQSDIKLIAPEYTIAQVDGTQTRKESMVWEFGNTINRLSEEQLKILWSSGNIFSNHRIISLWEKLKEFSYKMTAEKPEDRPPFDICITKLQGIVDKYLD